jgi:hypothetical protein
MRILSVIFVTSVTFCALAAAAPASRLIDRNATGVRLAVDDQGRALLRYRARGRQWNVLAWGAVDARQPTTVVPQVDFKLDYSGDRGRAVKTFRNRCARYDGPPLAWVVAACKAPDGTYWALQRWQRLLPNAGYRPWTPLQEVWELRLSHWTRSGGIALFEVYVDWAYSVHYHEVFGRVTYQGQAVHGFRSQRSGAPIDPYGRNVYLDTLDSAYGPGWWRENSLLAHNPSGMFCFVMTPLSAYPGYPAQRTAKLHGVGSKYRATMIGPGVTPDVMWTGDGLSDYNAGNPAHVELERMINAKLDAMAAAYGEKQCRRP